MYFLFFWSFIEAWFIIPIPPDALLIPMSIANPSKAYFYAYMTTISSVIGGLLGYLIGYFAIDFAMTYIDSIGLIDAYAQATDWFKIWGSAVILIAGFTVIPFKIFKFNLLLGTLKKVNIKQVVNHPNWKMGKKISTDSATMINKVFEVIEAKKIFKIPYNKLLKSLAPNYMNWSYSTDYDPYTYINEFSLK